MPPAVIDGIEPLSSAGSVVCIASGELMDFEVVRRRWGLELSGLLRDDMFSGSVNRFGASFELMVGTGGGMMFECSILREPQLAHRLPFLA